MTTLPKSPTLGAGLTTAKAQQWVIVSAITVGGMYFLRRLVEGAGIGTSNTSRGRLTALLGMGSPAPLAEFMVSYGITYFVLALMALGAPELAAAFAILVMAVNAVNNGQAVSTDLGALQHGQLGATVPRQVAAGGAPGVPRLHYPVQTTGNGQAAIRVPGA